LDGLYTAAFETSASLFGTTGTHGLRPSNGSIETPVQAHLCSKLNLYRGQIQGPKHTTSQTTHRGCQAREVQNSYHATDDTQNTAEIQV